MNINAYKVIVQKKEPIFGMRLKIHSVLQIGNTMTTFHGSLSINNYDKSAEFEEQLKFKFFSVNSLHQISSQSDTLQVNVSTVPSYSPQFPLSNFTTFILPSHSCRWYISYAGEKMSLNANETNRNVCTDGQEDRYARGSTKYSK